MTYRTIHCPYCGLELQVPENVDHVVCMYCAKPIDLKALFTPTAAEPDGGEKLQSALAALEPALFHFENGEPSFTKKDYPDYFADYSSRLGVPLEALRGVQAEDCHAFAQALMSRIADELSIRHIRSSHNSAFFSYRLMLTVYLLPSLHDSQVPEAAAVMDEFLKIWNSKYPKEPLNAVGYDCINNGWRKRACYITTAVCGSLHKPDNCRELQTLRAFRDNWLCHQPAGPLAIQEYYAFAPAITAKIDASPAPEAVYRSLWETVIFPCVQDAQAGRSNTCFRRYAQMMLRLEKEYLS
ncbi:MAG: hypothetical protein LKE53_02810 [Oscillospiraceae bacterium]|jgi:hypothetical protein|nr:hypothetical protein [Oscillospiraceae bacterium]MDD3261140.1 hypothetical protein [Oscillospiraceae bacterium]